MKKGYLLLLPFLLVMTVLPALALQNRVEVKTSVGLEKEMAKIESEIIQTSGFDKKRVFGITFSLQSYYTREFISQGKAVTIYADSISKVITGNLEKGKDKKEIGEILVRYARENKFEEMATKK